MKSLFVFLALAFMISVIPYSYAETLRQSMEGGMDLEITYPDSVMNERMFSIAILLQNNGWENKQDISFTLSNPDGVFISHGENTIIIDELTTTSSFGTTIDYQVSKTANEGSHFLNIDYTQVLVSNNVDPMEPTQTNIALPITIFGEPVVVIQTVTPESIFSNSEFTFETTVLSEDIDLKDVTVQIITPDDIEFRGDTSYVISLLEKQKPYTVTAEMITPTKDVTMEHTIPVKVLVSYTDDLGEENTETQSVPLLLRPKMFMEVTNDWGIWIGDFFIAPYVSVGTIVGIPAGTILSLLIRNAQNKKKKQTKSK
tara:strand:+ start:282 stop:1223 length:942 start_codon:yes stop_codon:yes gene_type:complete